MEDKYLKIQLYVNDSETKNRGTFVSEKFHIFLDNISFCIKHHQRTDFYETDLTEREHGNLLEIYTLKEIMQILDDRKEDICKSCYSKFKKWLKEQSLSKNETEHNI
ncbi:MAG: hypothetical protein J6Q13_02835 [Clostridia bacterium]|nr:hypothetical protein [Clostridia bacterium]